jgi:succinylglutamate desuccinylase
MAKIYSKALDQSIEVERIINRLSTESGPCLIFLAGIHGNEPSGIFALKQVFNKIEKLNTKIKGTVYGISGNLWALEKQERFHKTDLNRLWTRENINKLGAGTFKPNNEDEKQQLFIQETINLILEEESGPFYFFDLHTTSSDTIPFITVNDSLLNREFTSMYPLPSILGIEEYLEGPLLSYINEQGYVSFGFESGQHDTIEAIENHKIFVLLSLVFTGVLERDLIPFNDYMKQWEKINPNHQAVYEIFYRHEIQQDEEFEMSPGFSNFSSIAKGQVIATSNNEQIKSRKASTIFMPLYQSKGSDGYFLVQRTPKFFLSLSAFLRRYQVDRIFPILPRVKWASAQKDSTIVNLKTARFIARPLFHLFGYRSKQKEKSYLYIRNREYRSRKSEYLQENWCKISSNNTSKK